MPPARLTPLALLAVPSLAAATPPPQVDVAVDAAVDVRVDVHVDVNVTPERRPPRRARPPQPPVVVTQAPEPERVSLMEGSGLEAAVLLEGGRFDAADVAGPQFGVRGIVAGRFGPLRLGIEGSLAKFSGSRDLYDTDGWWRGWEDHGGEVIRYGATARYRVAGGEHQPVTTSSPLQLAFYLEAGVGRQRIAWDGGGEVSRNDVALGLGVDIGGGQQRFGGLDMGVRVLASPTLEGGSGCGPVCTRASTDRTHDLGVLIHLGGTFGT